MWRGEWSLTSAAAARGALWGQIIEEDLGTHQMRVCPDGSDI